LSWAEFNTAPIDKGVAMSFEVSAELEAGETSVWYIVPSGKSFISVTVFPSGGGTAMVQTTTDSINNIKNDNEVIYVNWISGEVSVLTQDSTLSRVNAIRCTNTSSSGIVKFTAVC